MAIRRKTLSNQLINQSGGLLPDKCGIQPVTTEQVIPGDCYQINMGIQPEATEHAISGDCYKINVGYQPAATGHSGGLLPDKCGISTGGHRSFWGIVTG